MTKEQLYDVLTALYRAQEYAGKVAAMGGKAKVSILKMNTDLNTINKAIDTVKEAMKVAA